VAPCLARQHLFICGADSVSVPFARFFIVPDHHFDTREDARSILDLQSSHEERLQESAKKTGQTEALDGFCQSLTQHYHLMMLDYFRHE
jgi:hypothetical protein